ncbi:hypothetical protein Taro_023345 [Colocasia esculenta]|uniref:Aminotransferase-like plant mobile domain-containing protein n=1 Tax=Colocasia esculenta TaxID=4460 RepID=A0A843VB43_COLES|nr:hypothetical protein [Colocasia esculenta]
MGFVPILEIEPFYVDIPLIQAIRERLHKASIVFLFPWGHMVPSLEDVTRITGLRVDGEAVIGVTYANYAEHTDDFLGLGDRRMVDRVVLMESLGLRGDPEDREMVDKDLRRFLVFFLGKMLLGTKGNGIHCHFLEILEDLERVGQYAWGAAFLAHTFADLSSGTGWETTPYAGMGDDGQPWVESGYPQFRGDLWVHCLNEIEPLRLRLAARTLGLHQAWHDEVESKGIGRRTCWKEKRVDWPLRFPDQFTDWQHSGYPVESDAIDHFAYLQQFQEYGEWDFMRPVRDARDRLIDTLWAQLASTEA